MKTLTPAVQQIELRVSELAAVFNSMDPTPFHNRDLDKDAAAYLENCALEFPQKSRFAIIIHVDKFPTPDPTPLLAEAIQHYFGDKADGARRRVRLLLREGRASLLIGIGFLTLCLLGADLLSAYASNTFLRMLKESLLIGGWVAMWRPLQIFLYEWWPIARTRRMYHRLSCAPVHVLQTKS